AWLNIRHFEIITRLGGRGGEAELRSQLDDEPGFGLGVPQATGAALDLSEAAAGGLIHAVDVDVALGLEVAHQPAATIFLDLDFPFGLEMLPVEAQALVRRGQVAAAREHHLAGQITLVRVTDEGQAVARVVWLAVVLEEDIFTIAQDVFL